MSKKVELVKLRKMISKLIFSFEEIDTNEGFTLIYDGELAENVQVYTYDENGEKIVAPDGIYTIDNWGSVTIENGIVVKIEKIQEETEEVETTETEVETTETEVKMETEVEKEENPESIFEKETKEVETVEKETEEVSELEKRVELMESKINEILEVINSLIKNVEYFSKQPVDEKIEKPSPKTIEIKNKENKALKYFGK